jgi:uncharacterized membrane protein
MIFKTLLNSLKNELFIIGQILLYTDAVDLKHEQVAETAEIVPTLIVLIWIRNEHPIKEVNH